MDFGKCYIYPDLEIQDPHDEHLESLENDLQNIKWDVIGISEIRRKGDVNMILKSDNILFQ